MRNHNATASIRTAGEQDAPAFRDAVRAVAQERCYLATIDGFSLEDTVAYLARLEADRSPALVAYVDTELVGSCDICRRPG